MLFNSPTLEVKGEFLILEDDSYPVAFSNLLGVKLSKEIFLKKFSKRIPTKKTTIIQAPLKYEITKFTYYNHILEDKCDLSLGMKNIDNVKGKFWVDFNIKTTTSTYDFTTPYVVLKPNQSYDFKYIYKGKHWKSHYAVHTSLKDIIQYQPISPEEQKKFIASVDRLFDECQCQEAKLNFAVIAIKNLVNEPQCFQVEVELQGYSEPVFETVMVPANEETEVKLTPAVSDEIYEITEQKIGNILIKLTDGNGNLIFGRTKQVTLLSRNDMVWSHKKPMDLVYLVGSFVTPHPKDKSIDKLLRLAVDYAPYKALGGYQDIDNLSHKQIMESQAKAIYDALTYLGIRYVNAPVSFGFGAQRIKYPSEVLSDRSGNCIEMAVLFASCFEAMDMYPVIIIVPEHAFVGVHQWHDENELILIETARVGYTDYYNARNSAIKTYTEHVKKGDATEVDINFWRCIGIRPIPY